MLVQKLSWIVLLLFLCQHDAEAKRTVVCEWKTAYLSCDWGFIKITHANYGRTDRSTCSTAGWMFFNTHCYEQTSLHTMAVRCDGRRTCSVPAENSVFSDPCFGTFKYLDVSYDCQL